MANGVLLRTLAVALALYAGCAGALVPGGDYASARSPDDEYVLVRLLSNGKAQIITEHNFLIPGDQGRRRGRTTAYGKWTSKGDVVTLIYARVRDRMRYSAHTSLSSVGLEGAAPGLTSIKPVHPKSRLRGATFWIAPHTYKKPADRPKQTPAAGDAGAK